MKLSQPREVVNVSLYVPAVEIVWPLNTTVWPLHNCWVILVVGVGLIVTVNTMKLSQPKEVLNVSLNVPAVVIVFPLNTIEVPLQIAWAIFVVGVGFNVTVKTMKLSQPKEVVNVSLNVPAVLIVFPLNKIELPWQIDWLIFVVGVGLMVVVKMMKLSQPSDVVKVSLNTPAVIIVFPLNTIELPWQIDWLIFVVGVGLIVVVKTMKLSQPSDVDKVSLNIPAVVIVLPLKTIEEPWQIACVRFVVGVGFIVWIVPLSSAWFSLV